MYDLLIIGGGINGAGIARDAAGRGLKVLLCEKDDLASHTSSASTKLIHGGLRYLEHYDFALVRKALKEREVLLKAAPHIVWPLRFVLPHHKDLRPAWLIRLGLFLYDHLGGRKLLPPTKTRKRSNSTVFSPLKAEFDKGFEYSDCWVEDARLVVLNAMDAAARGATIMTRTECVSIEDSEDGWTAQLRCENGDDIQVAAKAIVNAAGPWVDQVANAVGTPRENTQNVRLVKGSHIIVPKLFDDPRCFIFQAGDERIVFAIPYEDGRFTLIGTTDLAFEGDLDQVRASDDEIEYLCNLANQYFQTQISADDVVSTYSGVRPLFEDHAKNASSVTRDYVLKLRPGDAPFLSVIGGKITTYRKLAEDALKTLKPALPTIGAAWTELVPLPGGDIAGADFAAFEAACAKDYDWLDDAVRRRLARTYGTRIHQLLDGAMSMQALGHHYGAGLYQREVDYLMAHEFARSAEDILKRRTKLGLHMTQAQIDGLQRAFSEPMPVAEP